MADKDHEPQETVGNVNTDLRSEDNPLNSNGFIGVDPWFQSPALDPQNPEQEKEKSERKGETRKAETEKTPALAPAVKAEAPKTPAPAPAPAAPATPATPATPKK